MTEQECAAFERKHPDLPSELRDWRAAHPAGTVADAIKALRLWRNPRDGMAQRFVWWALKELGDPVALRGFDAVGGKLR